MRIKGVISYDGSNFFGFQKQPGRPTIQGKIEEALNRIGIDSPILYGGRTDRGVHGLNQVVAFDIPLHWERRLEKMRKILNFHLHPAIYFKQLTPAPPDFHPSYWAIKRGYRYIFTYRFSPFTANYTLYTPTPLPLSLLNRASQLLIGVHDFRHFAKTGTPVGSYRREIFQARFYPISTGAVFQIEGSGFLRGQVRLIVAFLLEIARGKLTLSHLKRQLEGIGVYHRLPAPPNGLYLHRIWYPLGKFK